MNAVGFAFACTSALPKAFGSAFLGQRSQRCLSSVYGMSEGLAIRSVKPLAAAQLIQPPPEKGRGSGEPGQIRIRQHLNPLARRWLQPVELPENWYATAFQDVDLPLTVDVGVAKGRFLHKLALQNRSRNFLGLEIREPLVHNANRAAADAGLKNLFFIACNANVSLAQVLSDAPAGALKEVYVQFCDPWFKKRHAKRRMVNPPLVDAIHDALRKSQNETAHMESETESPALRVFMQSDVLEVATEMRDIFDSHGGFLRAEDGSLDWNEEGWLNENPIGEPTEREVCVLKKNGRVFRALYRLDHTSIDSAT